MSKPRKYSNAWVEQETTKRRKRLDKLRSDIAEQQMHQLDQELAERIQREP